MINLNRGRKSLHTPRLDKSTWYLQNSVNFPRRKPGKNTSILHNVSRVKIQVYYTLQYDMLHAARLFEFWLWSTRLDLPGFWPGTETKWEVWLLRTGFDIAPVTKLVSLTWLLWALRSFRSFTLHYITYIQRSLVWSWLSVTGGHLIYWIPVPRRPGGTRNFWMLTHLPQ